MPRDLQPMEIIDTRPCLYEHALHRAGIDITNVRAGRDRAAVAQTFQDALQRFVGHLGVLVQRATSFTETLAAVAAIQSANVLAFANPFDDAEVAGIESVERGAIIIGARQVRQVRLAA